MTQTSNYEMCEQQRCARVKGLQFSPINETLSCVLHTGELNVNDVTSGKMQKQLQLISEPLRCCIYMKVGTNTVFAVGGDDGRLRLFEGLSMRPMTPIMLHKGSIRCLLAHPKSPILFSGGDDGLIKVVKINEVTLYTELLAELQGHNSPVSSLSIDPLGARLCSGGFDGKVKVWDSYCFVDLGDFATRVQQGKLGSVVQRDKNKSSGIAQSLGVYSAGNALKKLQSMGVKSLGNQVMGAATALLQGQLNVFRPDDSEGYSRISANEIQTPLVAMQPLFTLPGGESCVNAVTWIESDILGNTTSNPYAAGQLQFAASANDDGEVIIWDTYARQALKTLSGHSGIVNCLVYIKEEGILASAGDDGRILLHDCSTLQLRNSLHVGLGRIWCLTYKNSGLVSMISAGSDDGWSIFKYKQRPPICAFYTGQGKPKFAFQGDYHHKYALNNNEDQEKTRVSNSHDQIMTLGMFSFKQKTSKVSIATLCLKDGLSPEEQLKSKTSGQEYEGIEELYYSPNGQVLAIKTKNEIYMISSASGKQKSVIEAYAFAYAHDLKVYNEDENENEKETEQDDPEYVSVEDAGIYAIITKKKRNIIEVYEAKSSTEPLYAIEADFQIDKIHSGPLLTVSGGSQIAFYDWKSGHFIAQLDDLSINSVTYAKNNVACIICDNQIFIIQLQAKDILEALENEDYDDYDGFPEGIADLGSISMKVSSAAFGLNGKLLILVDQNGAKQLYIDELIQQYNSQEDAEGDESESDEQGGITPVYEPINVSYMSQIKFVLGGDNRDIYFVGTPTQELYDDISQEEQVIAAVPINRDLMTFKQLCSQKNLEEAITFAKTNLLMKPLDVVTHVCELLKNGGVSSDEILDMFDICQAKLTVAQSLGRLDIATQLVLDNSELAASVDLQRLGHKAFELGQLESAYDIYRQIKDDGMCLLCSYILGDAEKLKETTQLSQSKSTKFKAFWVLDDEDRILELLDPAQKLQWKWARGQNIKEDFETWKQYLREQGREEAAAALASPEE